VEFRDGTTYQYADVPVETYHDLLQADSKGAYFNRYSVLQYGGPADTSRAAHDPASSQPCHSIDGILGSAAFAPVAGVAFPYRRICRPLLEKLAKPRLI
jgi:hypothetical protein